MSVLNVNMSELVSNLLIELIGNQKKRLITTQGSNLHPCHGDQHSLRQVWYNYIANALKYSERKKEAVIEISSYVEDELVVYFNKDNGVGFDNQYALELFGICQRLHRRQEFEGTGLGLATCRRIIERHAGKVWAKGEMGKGATFYFSIPK